MVIIECAGIGCQNLTSQVQRVPRVGSSVTLVIHSILLARLDLVLRDFEVTEVIRSFDEGRLETRGDVVFDVAMEEPDAGIIRLESPDRVAILVQHDGVSADGCRGDVGGVCAGPDSSVRGRSFEDLELMAVEMHGVEVVMAVVDDKLDDLSVFEYEWIGIDTVDKGIGAVVADRKRSV